MSISDKVYNDKEAALQAVAGSVGVDLQDEPDVPQLRKLQDWVFAQAKLPISERTWDQGNWVRPGNELQEVVTHKDLDCGTACCMAGMQGLLDGLHLSDIGYITDPAGNQVTYLEEWLPGETGVVGLAVSDWAERRLGLDDVQAGLLFSGSNDEGRIKEVITRIVGEEL